MQKFEKMPFNDTCVAALEKLLERAREGRINWLGYSICEGPLYGEDGFCGELSSFYTGHYGLIHCAHRVMERLDAMPAPQTNLEPPADAYCYDVSVEPISFDFIAWLVYVKMLQEREKVTGPTKICFVRNTLMDNFIDGPYRAKFYESVMYPSLCLFDCAQDVAAKEGRRVNSHTYAAIVEAAKKGATVPRLRVPEHIMNDMEMTLEGIEPVVITLREHMHHTHRNSGLTDWIKFAGYLQERGEHVIFVRDFAKADEDITGFETMPEASRNIIVRAALYESAKCNLFVSNGPSTVALFGNRPWLQFIHCDESEADKYIQNTPQWWYTNHGIVPGEQFPWSEPNQRIIWQPDTYEAMVLAWEEMFPATMAEAAE